MGKQRVEWLWHLHTCPTCGKEFRSSKPWAKHCSDACKQAAYRERKVNDAMGQIEGLLDSARVDTGSAKRGIRADKSRDTSD